MRKLLLLVALVATLTSCGAFGMKVKSAICGSIETVKAGVTAVTSLAGPLGGVIAAPINLALEITCESTQWTVGAVTHPGALFSGDNGETPPSPTGSPEQ